MLALRTIGDAGLAPALAAIATRLQTLEDVIRRPELRLCDVIVQDEFTHDVIVEVTPAVARFLVFDAT